MASGLIAMLRYSIGTTPLRTGAEGSGVAYLGVVLSGCSPALLLVVVLLPTTTVLVRPPTVTVGVSLVLLPALEPQPPASASRSAAVAAAQISRSIRIPRL